MTPSCTYFWHISLFLSFFLSVFSLLWFNILSLLRYFVTYIHLPEDELHMINRNWTRTCFWHVNEDSTDQLDWLIDWRMPDSECAMRQAARDWGESEQPSSGYFLDRDFISINRHHNRSAIQSREQWNKVFPPPPPLPHLPSPVPSQPRANNDSWRCRCSNEK